MAMKSGSLDYWRNYFRGANCDIFDIIDCAIMVAASDCPKEFRLRRDRIAEMLFSCRLNRCLGCNRVELAVPADGEDGGCKSGCDRDGGEFESGASKESKVNSSRDDHGEMNMNQVSNYSYGDAEALTDEIEEQSQVFGEVLRIKEVLFNREEESDSVLFDSLRRLQLMDLTVDTLKATEIGKVVNALRKHGSKQIRNLARILIDVWKEMVDEWANATANIAGTEATPESTNPSAVDREEEEEEEEGLPSPPMDEGAFFATQPTSMELSGFFDGMDDDGNPRNVGEFIKNRENGRKLSQDSHSITKRKQQTSNVANVVAKDSKIQQQKADRSAIQRRLPTGQQDKLKCSDEAAVQVKLEATKRKLQERYQQAENAKKQRTIQVMELHDLPKQGMGHRHPHVKPGNHNRQWAHGRR
ncbi:Transcription elongation factor [Quillaja saponaria]|uniref:Transcription elongation factor n=1 Tax=Quillaja saponaria TaxID=32244 RepID=A0AAD7VI55_QUISA|nr:Transcription elongation factor [Quillaja saponaria]